MVDRTAPQEIILAEQTQFKIKRSTASNYAIFDDIIDDNVQFAPEGNEPKKFEAISGKAIETPGKIRTLKAGFTIWVGANDLEAFRTIFGEPTTTGTGPYVHTFNANTIGVDLDFVITGTRYGSSTEKVTMTGTGSTIKLQSLNIEKGGIWKMQCEVTVSAQNLNVAVTSDTDMSSQS